MNFYAVNLIFAVLNTLLAVALFVDGAGFWMINTICAIFCWFGVAIMSYSKEKSL